MKIKGKKSKGKKKNKNEVHSQWSWHLQIIRFVIKLVQKILEISQANSIKDKVLIEF